jgi:hypothetical protein
MLYCALTGQLIAKSLDAVKLHMKGKKFIRAKGGNMPPPPPRWTWVLFLPVR